ncbi:FAD-binding oxidoreductase [Romeria aff. gracilis LEGE 07310]|uniref:FAD-binding oxidoreductase n=1 Tax=Vasconcelosia minhoensis LEGE 07310 TaxID=915328 RepID=A0A8J7DMS4_9CYAN|nr:FAD-dependent oxidoreductase [Romeria gracilis]MBE9077225.1 FAD-binding oxidoreductase [Romeria aff. gracilis LEGE 07310]
MTERQRRVVVIGCGIVGAMIAYELSQDATLDVLVLDRQPPAQGATGAALGVLMGIINHKVKGRSWRLRQASIERYPSLIAELETQLQRSVPFNRQGIVSLCFSAEKLTRWQSLQAIRAEQGWPLEIWSPAQLKERCPQIETAGLAAAIYSPQDGQVHPAQLTQALVTAAQQRGVRFNWRAEVTELMAESSHCQRVCTTQAEHDADWVVVSAGLGAVGLSQVAQTSLRMIPVLGQAMAIRLAATLGDRDFQPVINGNDIHLVPNGDGHYWLGATVEFPPDGANSLAAVPQAELLEEVRQGAIAYCPTIAQAQITKTWTGFRPRPKDQAAPVIAPLSGYDNVILATGHYRNGVLLAPATAKRVKEMILNA